MPSPNIVGATQARGIIPSTSGIASRRIDDRRRVAGAMRRVGDALNMVNDVFDAAASNDPVAVEIANRLLGNPQFMKTMLHCLEQQRDELKASIAAGKAAPADEVNADPTARGHEDPDDLRTATHLTTDSAVDRYFKGPRHGTSLDEYFKDPNHTSIREYLKDPRGTSSMGEYLKDPSATGIGEYFGTVDNSDAPAPVKPSPARAAPSIVTPEQMQAARDGFKK